MDYASYIAAFDRRMAGYIPQRECWTPVDEAIYEPYDPFRIPYSHAQVLQLRAVRFAFERHYAHNRIYRKFCEERGFVPGDIRTAADLDRIPLVPDAFFKDHPVGRDFSLWMGNIVTGDLPRIAIRRKSPTLDEVVGAFNEAGMEVMFSSGTSGRHTFIPRDRRTFLAAEYAIAKAVVSMIYPHWEPDSHMFLLMPDPRRTRLFAGRACAVVSDIFDDVRAAIDREVTTDLIRLTKAGSRGLMGQIAKLTARRRSEHMIAGIVRWLESHDQRENKVFLFGAPFIVSKVIEKLQKEGRRFHFGERGFVVTAGGWKSYEGFRIPLADFRSQVEQVLGIPPESCLDMYAMVESNACMLQCPEGHYLHALHAFFRPMVLDGDGRPLPFGEWGRFAFLDAAAASYPGFIISGDRVRMLERCPACDRPGPVLDPEVRRLAGEDTRGCAEEVRRMLAADLGDKEE